MLKLIDRHPGFSSASGIGVGVSAPQHIASRSHLALFAACPSPTKMGANSPLGFVGSQRSLVPRVRGMASYRKRESADCCLDIRLCGYGSNNGALAGIVDLLSTTGLAFEVVGITSTSHSLPEFWVLWPSYLNHDPSTVRRPSSAVRYYARINQSGLSQLSFTP
jgi:hypothetical protein